MELSARQQKILALIVEYFISSGEPIGSKAISSAFETSISSATIRNEMAELSEKGYLKQPHTSAGRIPSHKGYRYYVDNLMGRYELSDSEKFRISKLLKDNASEPVQILSKAGGILADMTGCAAVSTTPLDSQTLIKRVELVPIGKKTAMVILIASSGVIKSCVSKIDMELNIEILDLFYNIAAAHFIGKRASEIHTAEVQTIVASLGEKALLMTPLLVVLSGLAQSLSQAEVLLDGQSNLLNHRELESNACELIDFLNKEEPLSHILLSHKNDLSVLIGNENFIREMENSSLILSTYNIAGQNAGNVGIIGPTRIDYARLIPSIRFISRIISAILSESLDE